MSIGLVKLSVVCFYKRIFITPRFHLIANIVMVFDILWLVAAFLTQLFSAWPISQWWTFGGHRDMNYGAFITAFAAMDIFLDIVTLCLPIPAIRKLQMSRTRKFQLMGIFWLGLFCLGSAGVRLYYAFELSTAGNSFAISDNFFSYISVSNLIWSTIEPCTSIIAACLPTLTVFVRGTHSPESFLSGLWSRVRIFSSTSSTPSFPHSSPAPTAETNSQKESSKRAWYKLQELGNKGSSYTGDVEAGVPVGTSPDADVIHMERSFAQTFEEQPGSTVQD